MMIALLREPTPSFAAAISTHPEKDRIDFAKARAQHAAYVHALTRAGAKTVFLETLEKFPDAPFVEDTAVVLDNLALICSMKAESRGSETESILPLLRQYRPVEILQPPVFIDGGDVLDTGETLYVGLSGRTNREAAEYLQTRTRKKVVAVPVLKGLHLKSAVSYLGRNILVLDPARVESGVFEKFHKIEATPDESYAANCLALGEKTVLMAAGFPRLAEQVRSHGFDVVQIPMSEFEKADGGITCLSLRIP